MLTGFNHKPYENNLHLRVARYDVKKYVSLRVFWLPFSLLECRSSQQSKLSLDIHLLPVTAAKLTCGQIGMRCMVQRLHVARDTRIP